ncbi:MAG: hypothetical protein IJS59_07525 [Bacteroidaceae bacterium]|nr:hypothetical protein [Bacteroidaceae bacterium]
MRLLVFNPESDLALAANDAHYTPPASARRMAADLALLPEAWAAADDAILLADGTAAIGGERVAPSVWAPRVSWVEPWGWNPLVVQRLLRLGVAPSVLPSPSWLAAYRTLAGRATAAAMLRQLAVHPQLAPWRGLVAGEAAVCCSLDDALAALARHGGALFKQPWSGSGRGLHPAPAAVATDKTVAWLRRTLRTQGYVMAEPIYARALDIAAEFTCHGGGSVSYEGLSVFLTTPGGVYAGNLLAPEPVKRAIVGRHIPLPMLDSAVEALRSLIARSVATALEPLPAPLPVGVDMMLLADGRLHPCVEANWRMTMGMVALHLARRQPLPGGGRFAIACRGGRYEAVVDAKNHDFTL